MIKRWNPFASRPNESKLARTRGKLFVFEGNDGAGKSTLIRSAVAGLSAGGVECVTFSFPGRSAGTVGKLVHDIHHDPARVGIHEISAASLQALHVAAHLDAIQRQILPTLSQGRHVLLDRYWWSTLVYGSVAGVPRSVLRALLRAERMVWGRVVPDMIFLITRPGTETTAIDGQYERLARSKRRVGRVVRIWNNGSIEDAADHIVQAILKK